MKTATLFPDAFDEPPNRATPKPFHNRTTTSRTAADAVRPSVRSQVARVYDFVATRPTYGATDKEIQTGLQMSGDSQRPRRVWLRDNGYVDQKPDTLRNRSVVWIATGKPLLFRQSDCE